MYEGFFGLDEEPFRLTPDPRFLYLSPKHAEALAHLRLGLTESSGFVCITGEVGTGKTTLLRAFLAELGPNVAAAYTFVPPLSANELLGRICREFGIAVASNNRSDLVDALQTFLVAQHAAGRVCVVILDEAQALSSELLEQVRLLLNFETTTEKLLRIVLVGQPQLRKLLLDPDLAQLNQRITLRWHLGPLSYRQTVAYVKHRLGVAGDGRATGLFTVPALRLLHAVSGGVPRLINMVGHRALLTAFVNRRVRIRRRSVAHAYREIQAVPLPGTLSFAYRTGVVAAGVAVGVGLIAIGGPRLDGLMGASTPAPIPALVADQAGVEEQCQPATAETGAESMVQIATAVASAEPPPAPSLSGAELHTRLLAVDGGVTARASAERLLAAWAAPPLAAGEEDRLENLETVAWRRGLQALAFTGNRSMLRLLDLPVQLTLQAPEGIAPHFVTLVGIDGPEMLLDIDGTGARIEATQLDRIWSGQAHLLWRDFSGLGPVPTRGASGPAVMRLQELLRQAGVLTGEASGIFDAATESAVIAFQRAHQLEPDGRVGPFTRIVLYGIAGGHERPTLNGDAKGTS